METLQHVPEAAQNAQIEGFAPLEVSLPTEGVIFQYEPPTPRMKPNQVRHAQNLAMYTGFWHGSYYEHGRIQKPK